MNTVNLISKTPDRYEIREAFRTLRTNILFSGTNIKAIAVTSTTQNEGKSFVTMELAKSLASTGKKILLLDTDLRKSVLVQKHIEEGSDLVGLSHYLSGQTEADEIVYSTQYENFFVVFAGPYPPNPVELLGSSRFAEMMNYYRSVFDYIIIDTPPLGLVIDAAVVSAVCDGVVVNVAANHVSRRQVKAVKTQLERSGCHIIGSILNMSDHSRSYGYKNYLGYYKNYYDKPYGNYGKDAVKATKLYSKLNSSEK